MYGLHSDFQKTSFATLSFLKKSAKIHTRTPDYKAKLVTTRVVNGKYYTEYLQWLTGDGHAGMAVMLVASYKLEVN